MSSDRLKALVTGASSGIGAATAVELSRRGYAVGVHYFNNEEGGRGTVQSIRSSGGQAIGVKADVRRKSDVDELVATVLKEFGTIDVLVNNAGSLLGRVPFLEMSEDHWNEVFRLNVTSVFCCTQAVVKHMARQKSGVVINVASIAARHGGGPGAISYAAAKGAVLTLTRGLAKELAPYGIRVNGVNPGVILTPFHERFTTEEQMKGMVKTITMKRAGTPEEIATVIAFLASPDARYITGETIEVNGGQLMD
jgi:NAD(P)-dependent dehydrogenase (short-subunit alcohol dehydrogenase family)